MIQKKKKKNLHRADADRGQSRQVNSPKQVNKGASGNDPVQCVYCIHTETLTHPSTRAIRTDWHQNRQFTAFTNKEGLVVRTQVTRGQVISELKD